MFMLICVVTDGQTIQCIINEIFFLKWSYYVSDEEVGLVFFMFSL